MGLLARRLYDLNVTDPGHFDSMLEECSAYTADSAPAGTVRIDLKACEHHLRTVYFPRRGALAAYIRQSGAVPLHRITEESRYAAVISL